MWLKFTQRCISPGQKLRRQWDVGEASDASSALPASPATDSAHVRRGGATGFQIRHLLLGLNLARMTGDLPSAAGADLGGVFAVADVANVVQGPWFTRRARRLLIHGRKREHGLAAAGMTGARTASPSYRDPTAASSAAASTSTNSRTRPRWPHPVARTGRSMDDESSGILGPPAARPSRVHRMNCRSHSGAQRCHFPAGISYIAAVQV